MQNEFKVKGLKTRLDKYLAEQLKDISRSHIQRDIEAGQVLVNGKIIKESKFVVRKGDTVKYQVVSSKYQAKQVRATNTPLKVLYNNHGLLIIDKPAGLVVHPGAGFKGETLASALLYQFKDIRAVGEEGRSGIVHRLDKDTSGVMLVAKTPEMYEHLKNAFKERKIKKEYIALVLGKVEKPHGFIDTPIGKSKKDFRKYDTKNVIQAKEALTEYKVLEYFGNNNSLDEYTLLLVKLHTGRTHQIRVHFNSIGHPLTGDILYGGRKTRLDGLNRQFLHAKKIEVRLPDETWIEAESDLAGDLREVLHNLNSKAENSL
ncbi:MAG: RluA family pseudouridine synthase [Candidatus Doudnabacteria bacterium]|nr:RluA family pseudouridine synthase [Candidatus Doudnabacteria bacterium]